MKTHEERIEIAIANHDALVEEFELIHGTTLDLLIIDFNKLVESNNDNISFKEYINEYR